MMIRQQYLSRGPDLPGHAILHNNDLSQFVIDGVSLHFPPLEYALCIWLLKHMSKVFAKPEGILPSEFLISTDILLTVLQISAQDMRHDKPLTFYKPSHISTYISQINAKLLFCGIQFSPVSRQMGYVYHDISCDSDIYQPGCHPEFCVKREVVKSISKDDIRSQG